MVTVIILLAYAVIVVCVSIYTKIYRDEEFLESVGSGVSIGYLSTVLISVVIFLTIPGSTRIETKRHSLPKTRLWFPDSIREGSKRELVTIYETHYISTDPLFTVREVNTRIGILPKDEYISEKRKRALEKND